MSVSVQRQPSDAMQLHRLGLRWSPVLLGGAVALLVGGVGGALLGAVIAFVTPVVLSRLEPAAQRDERQQCQDDAAMVAQVLALAVAGGATVEQSVQHAISVMAHREHSARHLERLARALERGGGAEAWTDLAARVPAWQGIARPIARSLHSGAPVAQVLQVRAQVVRDQAHDAVMTQVRRLGVVLVLPVSLLLMPGFLLVGIVPIVGSLLRALLVQF